jgi:hypothetical protein
VVRFTHLPLYPHRKSPWYPLDKRLGGPQLRSGRGGEEKNSQPLQGLGPPTVQPVAQRCTEEYRKIIGLRKWNIRKQDMRIWTGFMWLRTGSSGHERQRIS